MGESFPVSVVVHEDARAFLARGEAWLERAEAEHNLILGVARGLAERGVQPGAESPFFATVECGGDVVGCAFRTPPHKLGLTRMPTQAAVPLVEAVASRFESLPAVLGPVDAAETVARAWSSRTGQPWSFGMRNGIYRLDSVTEPVGVAGEMRLAEVGDLRLVAEWSEGFTRDVGAPFATSQETRERWVAERVLFLWLDEGEPVAMATAHARTARSVRIGFVYTPPERRRSGYASGLVAAVSQRMLDEGLAFCTLYTDLANPTSNAIYQRIGYRQVCEVVDVDFEAPNLGT